MIPSRSVSGLADTLSTRSLFAGIKCREQNASASGHPLFSPAFPVRLQTSFKASHSYVMPPPSLLPQHSSLHPLEMIRSIPIISSPRCHKTILLYPFCSVARHCHSIGIDSSEEGPPRALPVLTPPFTNTSLTDQLANHFPQVTSWHPSKWRATTTTSFRLRVP